MPEMGRPQLLFVRDKKAPLTVMAFILPVEKLDRRYQIVDSKLYLLCWKGSTTSYGIAFTQGNHPFFFHHDLRKTIFHLHCSENI